MKNLKLSRTLAAEFAAAMVVLAAAGNGLPATLYVDVNSTNATHRLAPPPRTFR